MHKQCRVHAANSTVLFMPCRIEMSNLQQDGVTGHVFWCQFCGKCTWGRITPNVPVHDVGWAAEKQLCWEVPGDPGGQQTVQEPAVCPWMTQAVGSWGTLERALPAVWRRWSCPGKTRLECCVQLWAAQYKRYMELLGNYRTRASL